MAKTSGITGMEMRKVGRNMAKTDLQKRASKLPFLSKDHKFPWERHMVENSPTQAPVKNDNRIKSAKNVSADGSEPGAKIGQKGQKTRGTGAAIRGTRSMGPLG